MGSRLWVPNGNFVEWNICGKGKSTGKNGTSGTFDAIEGLRQEARAICALTHVNKRVLVSYYYLDSA